MEEVQDHDVLAAGLQTKQVWSFAGMIVPPVVYYTDRSSDGKFPCTISWTIRQGRSKWAHHLLWLPGGNSQTSASNCT